MGEQFKWNPSSDRMGQMLRQAVFMADQVTLEHLVKQRADLEARDEAGATPLHIAATQCRPEIISWLLKNRADVGAVDSDGFSALTWACVKGQKDTVTLLLEGRADLEEVTKSNGKCPLALSAERGHFDCVEELLAKRAKLEQHNNDGSTALMCAAHRSETEVVKHLLLHNSKVNEEDKEGWSALMYALNATVAPRASGGEAQDKKVNLDGCLGKKTSIEILILHKADVNARAVDGVSPLIVATSHDRPAAVRKLLESRADVNAASAKGQTALLMAAQHELPDVVRALIVAAADVNTVIQLNGKQESALSIAEKSAQKEIIDLLKKAGAQPLKAAKKGKKKK